MRFLKNLALLCVIFFPVDAAAQPVLTCSGGDFNSGGDIYTEATVSGANNMTMDYTGAISYPAPISGPATGTPIVCSLTGAGNNVLVRVRCDASRSIANPGGCCGLTNRTINRFTVRGSGNTNCGPSNCRGLGSNACTFRTTAAGTGTITLGARMGATHVKIGDAYLLSNHISGPVTVRARISGINYDDTADLSVVFNSLVSVSGVTDMLFGEIGYMLPLTGADRADLGTDGTIAYAGSFASQGGIATAGEITVNNVQDGATVEIYCDASATLTNGGTSSIQVTNVKVASEGSTGSYAGTGSFCNGSGGAAAMTALYTAGSGDQFFFGGRLNGGTASSFAGGTHSTANPGGTNLSVIVLTQ